MLLSMPPKTLKAISDDLKLNSLDDHAARARDLLEKTQGPGFLFKSKVFTPKRLAAAMKAYRRECGDRSIVLERQEDASTNDLQLQFEAIQLWQKYGVSVHILSQA